MYKPGPFKFAQIVSLKPTTRHVPSRPRFPGSIIPTRKLGIVQVKRHIRRIGLETEPPVNQERSPASCTSSASTSAALAMAAASWFTAIEPAEQLTVS
jgi:hypothetical protein